MSDDRDDEGGEQRPRWKPNAELLRALADARRDLKPGEESLFWDWTTTRDSAPEAEDLGAPRGEVFVSDKDAAAAYVPPLEVPPALSPRAATKSRIRVREDIDPRRQPTVKVARSSDPSSSGGGALESRTSDPGPFSDRATPPSSRRSDPESDALHYPTLGVERRRRIAWAVFFGTVTGVTVFFCLRLPRDTRPIATAPGTTRALLAAEAGPPKPRPVAGRAGTPPALPSASGELTAAAPRGAPPTAKRTRETPAASAASSAPVTADRPLDAAALPPKTADADAESFLIRQKGTTTQ